MMSVEQSAQGVVDPDKPALGSHLGSECLLSRLLRRDRMGRGSGGGGGVRTVAAAGAEVSGGAAAPGAAR